MSVACPFPFYPLTSFPERWGSVMHYETRVVVNRPVDEVFAFWSNPFSGPRRGGGSLGFRVTPPGPIGLGSTIRLRMVAFGLERTLSGVVTEWDPPHAVTFSFANEGPVVSGTIRTTLEATTEGTEAASVAEIEPRGVWKLLSPFVRPYMRRQAITRNQNMKRLLESGRG